jgi:GT2 family glycosyltransferase
MLGYVTWSPEVRPTPFMKWFGLDGPLFAYGHFGERALLDFRCFYTCNLSVKTEFLRKTGTFDEEFRHSGYEDTELGYRLEKNGLRLRYNPAAVAYHYRRFTFAEACRRVEQSAPLLRILEQKEAGKYLLELQARERPAPWPKGLLRTWAAPILRPVKRIALSPLKMLLDTQVPLPWALYRRFYFDATSRVAERRTVEHA